MAIYVIGPEEGLGPYKIGYTNNSVSKRLSALQTGSPVRLKILHTLPGDKDMEELFHWIFQGKRIHGEWFRLGEQELLMLIVIALNGIENCTGMIADYIRQVIDENPSENVALIVDLKLKGAL